LAELYNGGTGQVAKKKAETKIRGKAKAVPPGRNGATLGFEQTLWAAADKLRGHMDAAEYRHVILRLDLPQVHLRRLPRNDTRPSRRRSTPTPRIGRIHRRERVLGP
jgi:hypothetical protein